MTGGASRLDEGPWWWAGDTDPPTAWASGCVVETGDRPPAGPCAGVVVPAGFTAWATLHRRLGWRVLPIWRWDAGRLVAVEIGCPRPRTPWWQRGVAVVGLLLLSPVLLVVAATIIATSRGPVVLVQERRGWRGRIIGVHKFRSMYHQGNGGQVGDASRLGFRQAAKRDPRITPVGHLVRRTSLDELPQLWDVVRGDLDLIGPRPHPMALDDQFLLDVPSLPRRYLVRPGITGLAQVSGSRGQTADARAMRRRIVLDRRHLRRPQVMRSLRILFKTIFGGFITCQP